MPDTPGPSGAGPSGDGLSGDGLSGDGLSGARPSADGPVKPGPSGSEPSTPGRSAAGGSEPRVEVRRSKRRRRTVHAYRDGDRIVVLVPASLGAAEEAEWVRTMVARVQRAERRRRPSDGELMARALGLNDRFLGGLAVPGSVRWVDNQRQRWGSCTPDDRAIRLSARLQQMPAWVVDYVLVHELAHLLVAGHDAAFWAWVDRYPQAERARGYLLGWSSAAQLQPPPGQENDEDDV